MTITGIPAFAEREYYRPDQFAQNRPVLQPQVNIPEIHLPDVKIAQPVQVQKMDMFSLTDFKISGQQLRGPISEVASLSKPITVQPPKTDIQPPLGGLTQTMVLLETNTKPDTTEFIPSKPAVTLDAAGLEAVQSRTQEEERPNVQKLDGELSELIAEKNDPAITEQLGSTSGLIAAYMGGFQPFKNADTIDAKPANEKQEQDGIPKKQTTVETVVTTATQSIRHSFPLIELGVTQTMKMVVSTGAAKIFANQTTPGKKAVGAASTSPGALANAGHMKVNASNGQAGQGPGKAAGSAQAIDKTMAMNNLHTGTAVSPEWTGTLAQGYGKVNPSQNLQKPANLQGTGQSAVSAASVSRGPAIDKSKLEGSSYIVSNKTDAGYALTVPNAVPGQPSPSSPQFSIGASKGQAHIVYHYNSEGNIESWESYDTRGSLVKSVTEGPGSYNIDAAIQSSIAARVPEATYPDGSKATFTYNADGTTTVHVVSPAANNQEGYTPEGYTVEAAGGAESIRTYNSKGQLINELKEISGQKCFLTYDPESGQLTSFVNQVTGETRTYAYDASGHLKSITDKDGKTIPIALPPILDQREAKYTFAADGTLVCAEAKNGQMCFYDSTGKITQFTDMDGKIVTATEWNEQGQVVRGHDQKGKEMLFKYSPDGYLAGYYKRGEWVYLSFGKDGTVNQATHMDQNGKTWTDYFMDGTKVFSIKDGKILTKGTITKESEARMVISAYYQKMLGRDASAAEIDQWLAASKNGLGYNFKELTKTVKNSDEYLTKTIKDSYTKTLGREASKDEVAAVMAQIRSGQIKIDSLDATLEKSPEFMNGPAFDKKIQGIYERYYRRGAAQHEIDHWRNVVLTGECKVGDIESLFMKSSVYKGAPASEAAMADLAKDYMGVDNATMADFKKWGWVNAAGRALTINDIANSVKYSGAYVWRVLDDAKNKQVDPIHYVKPKSGWSFGSILKIVVAVVVSVVLSWCGIGPILAGMIVGALNAAMSGGNILKGAIMGAVTSFAAAAISAAATAISTAVTKGLDAAATGLQKFAESMTTFGQEAVKGWDAVASGIKQIVTKVGGLYLKESGLAQKWGVVGTALATMVISAVAAGLAEGFTGEGSFADGFTKGFSESITGTQNGQATFGAFVTNVAKTAAVSGLQALTGNGGTFGSIVAALGKELINNYAASSSGSANTNAPPDSKVATQSAQTGGIDPGEQGATVGSGGSSQGEKGKGLGDKPSDLGESVNASSVSGSLNQGMQKGSDAGGGLVGNLASAMSHFATSVSSFFSSGSASAPTPDSISQNENVASDPSVAKDAMKDAPVPDAKPAVSESASAKAPEAKADPSQPQQQTDAKQNTSKPQQQADTNPQDNQQSQAAQPPASYNQPSSALDKPVTPSERETVSAPDSDKFNDKPQTDISKNEQIKDMAKGSDAYDKEKDVLRQNDDPAAQPGKGGNASQSNEGNEGNEGETEENSGDQKDKDPKNQDKNIQNDRLNTQDNGAFASTLMNAGRDLLGESFSLLATSSLADGLVSAVANSFKKGMAKLYNKQVFAKQMEKAKEEGRSDDLRLMKDQSETMVETLWENNKPLQESLKDLQQSLLYGSRDTVAANGEKITTYHKQGNVESIGDKGTYNFKQFKGSEINITAAGNVSMTPPEGQKTMSATDVAHLQATLQTMLASATMGTAQYTNVNLALAATQQTLALREIGSKDLGSLSAGQQGEIRQSLGKALDSAQKSGDASEINKVKLTQVEFEAGTGNKSAAIALNQEVAEDLLSTARGADGVVQCLQAAGNQAVLSDKQKQDPGAKETLNQLMSKALDLEMKTDSKDDGGRRKNNAIASIGAKALEMGCDQAAKAAVSELKAFAAKNLKDADVEKILAFSQDLAQIAALDPATLSADGKTMVEQAKDKLTATLDKLSDQKLSGTQRLQAASTLVKCGDTKTAVKILDQADAEDLNQSQLATYYQLKGMTAESGKDKGEAFAKAVEAMKKPEKVSAAEAAKYDNANLDLLKTIAADQGAFGDTASTSQAGLVKQLAGSLSATPENAAQLASLGSQLQSANQELGKSLISDAVAKTDQMISGMNNEQDAGKLAEQNQTAARTYLTALNAGVGDCDSLKNKLSETAAKTQSIGLNMAAAELLTSDGKNQAAEKNISAALNAAVNLSVDQQAALSMSALALLHDQGGKTMSADAQKMEKAAESMLAGAQETFRNNETKIAKALAAKHEAGQALTVDGVGTVTQAKDGQVQVQQQAGDSILTTTYAKNGKDLELAGMSASKGDQVKQSYKVEGGNLTLTGEQKTVVIHLPEGTVRKQIYMTADATAPVMEFVHNGSQTYMATIDPQGQVATNVQLVNTQPELLHAYSAMDKDLLNLNVAMNEQGAFMQNGKPMAAEKLTVDKLANLGFQATDPKVANLIAANPNCFVAQDGTLFITNENGYQVVGKNTFAGSEQQLGYIAQFENNQLKTVDLSDQSRIYNITAEGYKLERFENGNEYQATYKRTNAGGELLGATLKLNDFGGVTLAYNAKGDMVNGNDVKAQVEALDNGSTYEVVSGGFTLKSKDGKQVSFTNTGRAMPTPGEGGGSGGKQTVIEYDVVKRFDLAIAKVGGGVEKLSTQEMTKESVTLQSAGNGNLSKTIVSSTAFGVVQTREAWVSNGKEYDKKQQLASEVDSEHYKDTFSYDSNGNVSGIHRSGERTGVKEIQRNKTGAITQTETFNEQYRVELDGSGKLISREGVKTDVIGKNSQGKVVSGQKSNEYSLAYDSQGACVRTDIIKGAWGLETDGKKALYNETSTTYLDKDGNVTKRDGVRTNVQVEEKGQLISGQKSNEYTIKYDSQGNAVRTDTIKGAWGIDSDGKKTTWDESSTSQLDKSGQVVSQKGVKTNVLVTENGKPVSRQESNSYTLKYNPDRTAVRTDTIKGTWSIDSDGKKTTWDETTTSQLSKSGQVVSQTGTRTNVQIEDAGKLVSGQKSDAYTVQVDKNGVVTRTDVITDAWSLSEKGIRSEWDETSTTKRDKAGNLLSSTSTRTGTDVEKDGKVVAHQDKVVSNLENHYSNGKLTGTTRTDTVTGGWEEGEDGRRVQYSDEQSTVHMNAKGTIVSQTSIRNNVIVQKDKEIIAHRDSVVTKVENEINQAGELVSSTRTDTVGKGWEKTEDGKRIDYSSEVTVVKMIAEGVILSQVCTRNNVDVQKDEKRIAHRDSVVTKIENEINQAGELMSSTRTDTVGKGWEIGEDGKRVEYSSEVTTFKMDAKGAILSQVCTRNNVNVRREGKTVAHQDRVVSTITNTMNDKGEVVSSTRTDVSTGTYEIEVDANTGVEHKTAFDETTVSQIDGNGRLVSREGTRSNIEKFQNNQKMHTKNTTETFSEQYKYDAKGNLIEQQSTRGGQKSTTQLMTINGSQVAVQTTTEKGVSQVSVNGKTVDIHMGENLTVSVNDQNQLVVRDKLGRQEIVNKDGTVATTYLQKTENSFNKLINTVNNSYEKFKANIRRNSEGIDANFTGVANTAMHALNGLAVVGEAVKYVGDATFATTDYVLEMTGLKPGLATIFNQANKYIFEPGKQLSYKVAEQFTQAAEYWSAQSDTADSLLGKGFCSTMMGFAVAGAVASVVVGEHLPIVLLVGLPVAIPLVLGSAAIVPVLVSAVHAAGSLMLANDVMQHGLVSMFNTFFVDPVIRTWDGIRAVGHSGGEIRPVISALSELGGGLIGISFMRMMTKAAHHEARMAVLEGRAKPIRENLARVEVGEKLANTPLAEVLGVKPESLGVHAATKFGDVLYGVEGARMKFSEILKKENGPEIVKSLLNEPKLKINDLKIEIKTAPKKIMGMEIMRRSSPGKIMGVLEINKMGVISSTKAYVRGAGTYAKVFTEVFIKHQLQQFSTVGKAMDHGVDFVGKSLRAVDLPSNREVQARAATNVERARELDGRLEQTAGQLVNAANQAKIDLAAARQAGDSVKIGAAETKFRDLDQQANAAMDRCMALGEIIQPGASRGIEGQAKLNEVNGVTKRLNDLEIMDLSSRLRDMTLDNPAGKSLMERVSVMEAQNNRMAVESALEANRAEFAAASAKLIEESKLSPSEGKNEIKRDLSKQIKTLRAENRQLKAELKKASAELKAAEARNEYEAQNQKVSRSASLDDFRSALEKKAEAKNKVARAEMEKEAADREMKDQEARADRQAVKDLTVEISATDKRDAMKLINEISKYATEGGTRGPLADLTRALRSLTGNDPGQLALKRALLSGIVDGGNPAKAAPFFHSILGRFALQQMLKQGSTKEAARKLLNEMIRKYDATMKPETRAEIERFLSGESLDAGKLPDQTTAALKKLFGMEGTNFDPGMTLARAKEITNKQKAFEAAAYETFNGGGAGRFAEGLKKIGPSEAPGKKGVTEEALEKMEAELGSAEAVDAFAGRLTQKQVRQVIEVAARGGDAAAMLKVLKDLHAETLRAGSEAVAKTDTGTTPKMSRVALSPAQRRLAAAGRQVVQNRQNGTAKDTIRSEQMYENYIQETRTALEEQFQSSQAKLTQALKSGKDGEIRAARAKLETIQEQARMFEADHPAQTAMPRAETGLANARDARALMEQAGQGNNPARMAEAEKSFIEAVKQEGAGLAAKVEASKASLTEALRSKDASLIESSRKALDEAFAEMAAFESLHVSQALKVARKQTLILEAGIGSQKGKTEGMRERLEKAQATELQLRDLTTRMLASEKGSMQGLLLENGTVAKIGQEAETKQQISQSQRDEGMARVNEAKTFSELKKARNALESQQKGSVLQRLGTWMRGLPGFKPNGWQGATKTINQLKSDSSVGHETVELVSKLYELDKQIDGLLKKGGTQNTAEAKKLSEERADIALKIQNTPGAVDAILKAEGVETRIMDNSRVMSKSFGDMLAKAVGEIKAMKTAEGVVSPEKMTDVIRKTLEKYTEDCRTSDRDIREQTLTLVKEIRELGSNPDAGVVENTIKNFVENQEKIGKPYSPGVNVKGLVEQIREAGPEADSAVIEAFVDRFVKIQTEPLRDVNRELVEKLVVEFCSDPKYSNFNPDPLQLSLLSRCLEMHLLNFELSGKGYSLAQVVSGEALLLAMGGGKSAGVLSLVLARKLYSAAHNNQPAPASFYLTATDTLVDQIIKDEPVLSKLAGGADPTVIKLTESNIKQIIRDGLQPDKIYVMSNEGLKKIVLEMRGEGKSDASIREFFSKVGTKAWDEFHSAFHTTDTILGSSGIWPELSQQVRSEITASIKVLTENYVKVWDVVGSDMRAETFRSEESSLFVDRESRAGQGIRNQKQFNLDYVIKTGEYQGMTLREALVSEKINFDPASGGNMNQLAKMAQTMYNRNGREYAGTVENGRPGYGTAEKGVGKANTIYGDHYQSAFQLIDIMIKHIESKGEKASAESSMMMKNEKFVEAVGEALAHLTTERVTMLEAIDLMGASNIVGYTGTIVGLSTTMRAMGKKIVEISPEPKTTFENQVAKGEVYMAVRMGDKVLVLEGNGLGKGYRLTELSGTEARDYQLNRAIQVAETNKQLVYTHNDNGIMARQAVELAVKQNIISESVGAKLIKTIQDKGIQEMARLLETECPEVAGNLMVISEKTSRNRFESMMKSDPLGTKWKITLGMAAKKGLIKESLAGSLSKTLSRKGIDAMLREIPVEQRDALQKMADAKLKPWGEDLLATDMARSIAVEEMVKPTADGKSQIVIVDGMSSEAYAKAVDALKSAIHAMPKTVQEVLASKSAKYLTATMRASLESFAASRPDAKLTDWVSANWKTDGAMVRLTFRAIQRELGWSQERHMFAPAIGEGLNVFGTIDALPIELQFKSALFKSDLSPHDVFDQAMGRSNIYKEEKTGGVLGTEGKAKLYKRVKGVTGLDLDLFKINGIKDSEIAAFGEFFARMKAQSGKIIGGNPEARSLELKEAGMKEFFDLVDNTMNSYLKEIDANKAGEVARTRAGDLPVMESVKVEKGSPEYMKTMAAKVELDVPSRLREFLGVSDLVAVVGGRPAKAAMLQNPVVSKGMQVRGMTSELTKLFGLQKANGAMRALGTIADMPGIRVLTRSLVNNFAAVKSAVQAEEYKIGLIQSYAQSLQDSDWQTVMAWARENGAAVSQLQRDSGNWLSEMARLALNARAADQWIARNISPDGAASYAREQALIHLENSKDAQDVADFHFANTWVADNRVLLGKIQEAYSTFGEYWFEAVMVKTFGADWKFYENLAEKNLLGQRRAIAEQMASAKQTYRQIERELKTTGNLIYREGQILEKHDVAAYEKLLETTKKDMNWRYEIEKMAAGKGRNDFQALWSKAMPGMVSAAILWFGSLGSSFASTSSMNLLNQWLPQSTDQKLTGVGTLPVAASYGEEVLDNTTLLTQWKQEMAGNRDPEKAVEVLQRLLEKHRITLSVGRSSKSYGHMYLVAAMATLLQKTGMPLQEILGSVSLGDSQDQKQGKFSVVVSQDAAGFFVSHQLIQVFMNQACITLAAKLTAADPALIQKAREAKSLEQSQVKDGQLLLAEYIKNYILRGDALREQASHDGAYAALKTALGGAEFSEQDLASLSEAVLIMQNDGGLQMAKAVKEIETQKGEDRIAKMEEFRQRFGLTMEEFLVLEAKPWGMSVLENRWVQRIAKTSEMSWEPFRVVDRASFRFAATGAALGMGAVALAAIAGPVAAGILGILGVAALGISGILLVQRQDIAWKANPTAAVMDAVLEQGKISEAMKTALQQDERFMRAVAGLQVPGTGRMISTENYNEAICSAMRVFAAAIEQSGSDKAALVRDLKEGLGALRLNVAEEGGAGHGGIQLTPVTKPAHPLLMSNKLIRTIQRLSALGVHVNIPLQWKVKPKKLKTTGSAA